MFKPGQSGNPGGRPNSAPFRALARRYQADVIIGLVETARLRQPAYATARVAALRELRAIMYGDFEDDQGAVAGDALHLHLLAVNAANALPSPTPAPAPDGVAEAAEDAEDAEVVVIDMDLLPDPAEDVPGAALPLWEAYRARNKAEAAAKDAPQETVETKPSGAEEAQDDNA